MHPAAVALAFIQAGRILLTILAALALAAALIALFYGPV